LQLAWRRKGPDYLVYSGDLPKKAYRDVTIPQVAILGSWCGLPDPSEDVISIRQSRLVERVVSAHNRIEFAIDRTGKTIKFAAGPCLRGNAFKLIEELVEQHEVDLADRKATADYIFVQADALERSLGIDNELLRKWVYRARRDIKKWFVKNGSFSPDTHDVIQSDSWKGYRLNPDVRLISLSAFGYRRNGTKKP
jgi:hypothetical protein